MNNVASQYRTVYNESLTDRASFWMRAASDIDWVTPPTSALTGDVSSGFRWFADGTLNTCFNALDRHVLAGRGDETALLFDSAMTGTRRSYTYTDMLEAVSVLAGALRDQGVLPGDRVVIYLPMIPDAVFSMLACARLGAVHSVVFGGFAANELASRIDDAQPKLIITTTGGLEPSRGVNYLSIVEEALTRSAGSVQTVLVKHRPEVVAALSSQPNDTNGVADEVPLDAAGISRAGAHWRDLDAVVAVAQPVDAVAVRATDPLYILYTSGTTGTPKGIVRDNGGHAVALNWSMKHIYNVQPGEVMWTASDVGWVVGHSYIVYAPLIAGVTTVLYEGKPVGTPDAGAFWRVVQDYSVNVLFTAPTALRAIKRVDPELLELAKYDTLTLQTLFLAGERLDTETLHWAAEGLGVPVIDHWWQTETGWPITANLRGVEMLPVKPGSSTVPVPGYHVEVLDAKGRNVPANKEGNVVIKLPMPPGTLAGLWGQPDGMHRAYLSAFDGYYATGDSGFIDEDGYVFVMGRTDDVINVSGHRISTGALEEAVAHHDSVAECAVIGVKDAVSGQRPVALVTLKAGDHASAKEISDGVVAVVRDRIGPVAALKTVHVVSRLPKTRSGKILRKTLRQMFDGDEVRVPPTIEDVSVLAEIEHLLPRDTETE